MKYNYKKLVAFGLSVFLILGIFVTGCGNEDDTPTAQGSVIEESADTENQDSSGEILPEDTQQSEETVFVLPSFDETIATSVWTTSDVKFRTEPNTECDVIKVLKEGTEVKTCVVDDADAKIPEGWAFVLYDEQLGFVSADYLTEEEPKGPETKVEAIPGQHRDPNNIVICIDPGHQGKGDSTKEPNGPGSSDMKARVTSGTEGVATGVAEYVMNLEVSLMLREELENRGYTVYMTRTTHDVNISNMERAQYSTQVGADIAIRVHCNSVDTSSVRGAETMAPSKDNQYVSHLAKASQSLSQCVIDAYCEATGFKNRGVQIVDNMTGINWSEIPVTIIELGFMSNPEEDVLMQDANMKNNMVQGMADGIDDYFGLN